MASVHVLLGRVKDSENLKEQVLALQELTKTLDPRVHSGALHFIQETAAGDPFYEELKPYAKKCLEFLIQKHKLKLVLPTDAVAEEKSGPETTVPSAEEEAEDAAESGPQKQEAPAGVVCCKCQQPIQAPCYIHDIPIGGQVTRLYVCDDPCAAHLPDVIEKLEFEAAKRIIAGPLAALQATDGEEEETS